MQHLKHTPITHFEAWNAIGAMQAARLWRCEHGTEGY
jgi:hypothetical protein